MRPGSGRAFLKVCVHYATAINVLHTKLTDCTELLRHPLWSETVSLSVLKWSPSLLRFHSDLCGKCHAKRPLMTCPTQLRHGRFEKLANYYRCALRLKLLPRHFVANYGPVHAFDCVEPFISDKMSEKLLVVRSTLIADE
ncbi:hypothetical protein AVEN_166782-1 [Araneus ventricosus]|uniref:Uncharacterized protein n=1 Tax=Araneus ventricosus TaxID=182803 RepID=A0A4Y2BP75_ARAVE|nr:hypothetical protein AVEN_166782-1 [Araneus ventricosus]